MLPELELIAKLVMAVLLGGLLGLEREAHERPAGFRTHILVCMGSTLFAIISLYVTGPSVDSSRIAAGVVMGIGFLGAGAIFRTEDKVKGLTTAANLWVTAAIGVGIGTGYYLAAITATVLALGVLLVGWKLEKKVLLKQ